MVGAMQNYLWAFFICQYKSIEDNRLNSCKILFECSHIVPVLKYRCVAIRHNMTKFILN